MKITTNAQKKFNRLMQRQSFLIFLNEIFLTIAGVPNRSGCSKCSTLSKWNAHKSGHQQKRPRLSPGPLQTKPTTYYENILYQVLETNCQHFHTCISSGAGSLFKKSQFNLTNPQHPVKLLYSNFSWLKFSFFLFSYA